MTTDARPAGFSRDRLTWIAYLLLAWFAYLQASPGLVIGHLRDELDLDYAVGGLHVAAFAAGAMIAGAWYARAERSLGRRRLMWLACLVLATGTVGLTAARVPALTVTAVLVMGLGGGVLLTLIQALLADHHGPWRAVALTEANVAASVSYLLLVALLTLAAAVGAGWRIALLVSLLVPFAIWLTNRRITVDAPTIDATVTGRLPRSFVAAAVMLFCVTAAEWCITAWGASYVEDVTDVSTDAAVAAMAGYFAGVLVGRVIGSRLTRRHDPARLLGVALGIALLGFAVLWPSGATAQAVAGLLVLGLGLGNLFPMAISVTVSLAPDLSALASGRAVAVTSLAVLVAPLLVGTLADASSLRTALVVFPVLLGLAGVALVVVRRSPGQGDD